MTTTVPTGSVVVAYDGSEHATRALAWGLAQAALGRRSVDVVHALDLVRLPAEAWISISDDAHPLIDTLRVEASTAMEEAIAAAGQVRPDVEVRRHVVDGDPRRELVALSESAHLLVLGSHGRTRLASAMLGSVSTAVTRTSTCPTVVVRPSRPGAATTGGAGVVVGADGSPESRPVIEFAFAHASACALPLTVVHAVRDAMSAYLGDPQYRAVEDPEGGRLLLAESVAGMAEKYPDVEVTRRLERGPLAQVLERDADAWDLAVVGRRRHGAWHRLLVGSTTTAVLEHAFGPVAVVPEAPGHDG